MAGAVPARFCRKKRRHERFAVRAGRPVTQTTSGMTVRPITGITTQYYRFGRKQIQNLIFYRNAILLLYLAHTMRIKFNKTPTKVHGLPIRIPRRRRQPCRHSSSDGPPAAGRNFCHCLCFGGRSGSGLVLSKYAEPPPPTRVPGRRCAACFRPKRAGRGRSVLMPPRTSRSPGREGASSKIGNPLAPCTEGYCFSSPT